MHPILILREEVVCLVLLVFLAFISRTYRMGTDGKRFNRLLTCAIVHVVLDGVTVWTVNHTANVPRTVNCVIHVAFYLAAMLYAAEIFGYIVHLFYPDQEKKWSIFGLLPIGLYLVLLPFLKIDFIPCKGTWVSTGSAAYMGYAVGYLYFAAALMMIFRNRRRLSRHVRYALLPMMLILVAAETVQVLVREFLFTGGAVTIVTVGFFFSLENPVIVLERKAMTDAMTGVENRNGYERDIREYDRMYQNDPSQKFIFLFADINNLKSVNGMFGHDEGDAYITFIAVTLLMNLRRAEHIYRMGGDEFLAIYRNVEEKTVIRGIEKVREACAKEAEKKAYSPMLATGYAVSGPQYRNLQDVLRVADYMMYRNKAELKREVALEISHGGTKLNLTGLTERVFDAMCLSSDRFYPYMENLETGVTRVAPALAEYFGLGEEFFSHFADIWLERVHPEDRKAYQEDVTATLNGKKQYHYCTYRVRDKNGNYVQVTCRGGVYHGRDGEPDIFSGYIVNHGKPETIDPETGLENDGMMYDRIQELVQAEERAVVIRLEVTNLVRVRMLYGGETELTLQKTLADFFLKAVKSIGRVYRSMDGNYGFVLPGAHRRMAEELYRRLRGLCVNGIVAGETMIPVSMSAGAVILPDAGLKDKGDVRSALLYALEESRYTRHDALVFYHGGNGGRSEDEMRLLTAIHRDCSTAREFFRLRYQPIVDLQTGNLTGAEALLRWDSPEYGEVLPGRFISFLENDPAYSALGYDILRSAVRWARKMMERVPDFRIHVNITALQLYEEDFRDRVMEILREEGLPPHNLMLELTERCKEMELEDLKERVEGLRALGIRMALDDVGTGFSTINLLLHLQVDEIKLDSAFTRELHEQPNSRLYARTLCDAAAQGELDVCFEGVETGEMWEEVRPFGRVLAQGYYYDHPLTEEEFSVKYGRMP